MMVRVQPTHLTPSECLCRGTKASLWHLHDIHQILIRTSQDQILIRDFLQGLAPNSLSHLIPHVLPHFADWMLNPRVRLKGA